MSDLVFTSRVCENAVEGGVYHVRYSCLSCGALGEEMTGLRDDFTLAMSEAAEVGPHGKVVRDLPGPVLAEAMSVSLAYDAADAEPAPEPRADECWFAPTFWLPDGVRHARSTVGVRFDCPAAGSPGRRSSVRCAASRGC